MIAFYGMGLLGANYTRAMRRRGVDVRVWNRTHEKAAALAGIGAVPFEDPAEAARGVDRVHMVLSDDAAVDELLARIEPGLDPGTCIVDHTTTTAVGAARRAADWTGKGMRFLHAPVFMGPANALNGTGSMLASGDRAAFEAIEADLAAMTGRLVWLGDDPGRAAGMKLIGNLVLQAMTAGLSDGFRLARALGIPPEEAAKLFDVFNPGNTIPYRLERILGRDFSGPSWALAMARKDTRLMIEEAERGGEALAVMPAIAALMDAWLERGHAADDWTVISKDAVS